MAFLLFFIPRILARTRSRLQLHGNTQIVAYEALNIRSNIDSICAYIAHQEELLCRLSYNFCVSQISVSFIWIYTKVMYEIPIRRYCIHFDSFKQLLRVSCFFTLFERVIPTILKLNRHHLICMMHVTKLYTKINVEISNEMVLCSFVLCSNCSLGGCAMLFFSKFSFSKVATLLQPDN